MNKFEELKDEIIRRGYAAGACDVIHDAEAADTMSNLADIIKDHFTWCFHNKVIDAQIVSAYSELFNAEGIYHNEVREGCYSLIDGEVGVIDVQAHIYVYDNATINKVFNNVAIKQVYGNAIIKQVCDNAYVVVDKYMPCVVKNNAVLRVLENQTIYTPSEVEVLNN